MSVFFKSLLLSLFLTGFSFAATAGQAMEWVGCGISKKAYMTEMAKAYEKRKGIKINVNGGGATGGFVRLQRKKRIWAAPAVFICRIMNLSRA